MRPDDEEALCAGIKEVGAILEVHRADSTVYQSLNSLMGSLQDRTRIIGCMNLVMILQDSPFLTMSPRQWDIAVQAKVKSTLNLQLTTQKDPLDFSSCFLPSRRLRAIWLRQTTQPETPSKIPWQNIAEPKG